MNKYIHAAFAMLSFGMNRYEKKLCLSLAKKITKKR